MFAAFFVVGIALKPLPYLKSPLGMSIGIAVAFVIIFWALLSVFN